MHPLFLILNQTYFHVSLDSFLFQHLRIPIVHFTCNHPKPMDEKILLQYLVFFSGYNALIFLVNLI